ncbi:MAG: hypothetical protein O2887_01270 [Bacteroidetes bacterium]|nr:hypothetical protein [Bacteroidota bacterium]MDA1119120.1 hypothetical protein [Bacteroidota bacterium]
MMKHFVFSLIVIFLVNNLFAQDFHNEVKTLISKYNEVKGFGAVDFKITDVASTRALVAGAYGGVIINKQVILGLGGYGVTTNVDIPNISEDASLDGGYAGVILGFIIAPREVVHLTIPILIGAGSFHETDRQLDIYNLPRKIYLQSSSFAVVEPGLQIEINISKTVRLGLGGSYRYIQGAHLGEVTDSNLSNFTGNFTVKIGRF